MLSIMKLKTLLRYLNLMLYFKDCATYSATAQLQLFEIGFWLLNYPIAIRKIKHFKSNCNYTEITQQSILVAFVLLRAPA